MLSTSEKDQLFIAGTNTPKASSAQAAATIASTTAAASGTATAEQEKPLENGQLSLTHPASPPQNVSADHHQQQQPQQQEVPGTTLQESTTAAPVERRIVGEELDDRASTAAFSPKHHGDAVPLTATDQSAAHVHKPASTHTATDIVGEEQDPKASVPASQPDTAVRPGQKPEQQSANEASDELPMPHARGHEEAALTSQGSRSPHSQLDKGQANAQQEGQQDDGTRHGSSPRGHGHSHAESEQRHRRDVSAEAGDVEDGEMPSVPSEVTSEAVHEAADAVVGEELLPKASSATGPNSALRTSSRLALDSQHQALHGRALT